MKKFLSFKTKIYIVSDDKMGRFESNQYYGSPCLDESCLYGASLRALVVSDFLL